MFTESRIRLLWSVEWALLTPGDGYHSVEFGRGEPYFVDTYSRVDMAPVSVVRNMEGKLLVELEKVDVRKMERIGWKAPRRIQVKAADGVTDLYGVMYTPFAMDSARSYPIIAYVYPGPQEDQVPQAFALDDNSNQSLAQLGFVVVHVGFVRDFPDGESVCRDAGQLF